MVSYYFLEKGQNVKISVTVTLILRISYDKFLFVQLIINSLLITYCKFDGFSLRKFNAYDACDVSRNKRVKVLEVSNF